MDAQDGADLTDDRLRRFGYEFATEPAAREAASELDRRFGDELTELRVYRIRWNEDYLVEAAFSNEATQGSVDSARAYLGESGTAVHPDDLDDYKRGVRRGGGISGWFRRVFGG